MMKVDERTVAYTRERVPPALRGHSRRTLLQASLSAAGVIALAACGETSIAPTSGSLQPTGVGAGAAPSPTVAPSARLTNTATVAAPMPATSPATRLPATPPGSPTPVAGTMPVASPPTSTDGVIRSSVPGVPEAYLRARPPFRSVAVVPGRGGRVTTFQPNNIAAPPPPKAQNRYWQELEKRLGVTLDVTLAGANYAERLAAITAGGDLPDLTYVNLGLAPNQYRVIQQGGWTDLTPYLTGDALKEYPNLAQYPRQLWENARINGKVYGVPRPFLQPGVVLLFRNDWATKLGNPRPKNAEEFYRLLVDFVGKDPDGNGQQDSFGLGATGATTADPFGLDYFMEVFRVPSEWRRNADGSLTYHIETDEFRQAVAFIRRLFTAGVYHPNAATMAVMQANDALATGKIGGYSGTVASLPQPNTGQRDRARKAGGEVIGLAPFGHDGGRGVAHRGTGIGGFVMIPARAGRDRERVRELLRVADFYAAPYFSEEYNFLWYGLEGIHHTLQPDGSRVRTELGQGEISELYNLTFSSQVFYYPHLPTEATYMQGLVEEMTVIAVDNPVTTAYSPTATAKAAELRQLRIDRIGAIVQGRAPLSDLDAYVRDWRSRGGDTIRREYEDALKA